MRSIVKFIISLGAIYIITTSQELHELLRGLLNSIGSLKDLLKDAVRSMKSG